MIYLIVSIKTRNRTKRNSGLVNLFYQFEKILRVRCVGLLFIGQRMEEQCHIRACFQVSKDHFSIAIAGK